MKLCKATIYYYDVDNDNPHASLKEVLALKDWVYTEIFDTEEVEIGDWYDEIDLNMSKCTKEQYEAYFKPRGRAIGQILLWIDELMKVAFISDMTKEQAIEKAIAKYILLNPGVVTFEDKKEILQRYNLILECR